ncbi:hypothetical protein CC86DRAFT_291449, partial [Ophiobolus disseminans]
LLNVYGMWIVKLSICAYLLALNFSKTYRWVGTIVFATIFNFLLPATQHFGLCRPLASRWDTRIKDKHCWTQTVRISIAYTQAILNIVTDLVYATAPIAYLRSVQLIRQTQWSVRAVFLMSLVCTTISALKLWDFQRIQNQKEIYYEFVTLSIWSITEVAIGIVVANLPPLRKSFDGLFKLSSLPRNGVECLRRIDQVVATWKTSRCRNTVARQTVVGLGLVTIAEAICMTSI